MQISEESLPKFNYLLKNALMHRTKLPWVFTATNFITLTLSKVIDRAWIQEQIPNQLLAKISMAFAEN